MCFHLSNRLRHSKHRSLRLRRLSLVMPLVVKSKPNNKETIPMKDYQDLFRSTKFSFLYPLRNYRLNHRSSSIKATKKIEIVESLAALPIESKLNKTKQKSLPSCYDIVLPFRVEIYSKRPRQSLIVKWLVSMLSIQANKLETKSPYRPFNWILSLCWLPSLEFAQSSQLKAKTCSHQSTAVKPAIHSKRPNQSHCIAKTTINQSESLLKVSKQKSKFSLFHCFRLPPQ